MPLFDQLKSQKALIYFTLFGIVMGIQINLAKALAFTYRASYITFIRCMSFVLVIPFVKWKDTDSNCNTRDLVLYIIASTLNVVPYGTMNYSYNFLGAGDSNAVEFGASLMITAVVGHVFLKETVSILYFGLLLVNCAGVVMVAKPQFIFAERSQVAASSSREIGVIIALTGAGFGAAWTIMSRQLATNEVLYCYTMTAVQGLVGMVMAGLWCSIDSGWQTPTTWVNLCAFITYAISGITQCVISMKLLQQATAKEFAVSVTISVVISYILQITFFGEEVDVVRLVGAVLIIVCVFLSAMWTHIETIYEKLSHSGEVVDEEEVVNLMTQEEEY